MIRIRESSCIKTEILQNLFRKMTGFLKTNSREILWKNINDEKLLLHHFLQDNFIVFADKTQIVSSG